MANFVTIEAEARERAGKGAARASRRAGMVPAIIYGAKQTPTLIQLDPRVIVRELTRGGWKSRLYEINVAGTPSRALMREVQFHPVSDKAIHVDFQRLAAGERIRVSVTVQFQNEATSPGLKRGGVLNVVRHAVEVLADPDSVPDFFQADLAALDINDNVRFGDLQGTDGVTPTITGRDFVIATVAAPTKGAEPVADPNAPAAAAAPARGTKAPGKSAAPAAKAAAPAAKAPAKPAAKK
jgi:large subunit ribosomal protein L25